MVPSAIHFQNSQIKITFPLNGQTDIPPLKAREKKPGLNYSNLEDDDRDLVFYGFDK